MQFNEILAAKRKARGFSQEDLASSIQVSRQAVSKWETGDAMPDLKNLLALADALEVSLDTLCGREVPSAAFPAKVPSPGKKRTRLLPLFCVLPMLLLAAAGLLLWRQQDIPSEQTAETSVLAALTEDFTISGLKFLVPSAGRLRYQFTPSVCRAGLVYQITFTDPFGVAKSFDAPCSEGICSGTVSLSSGFSGYTVTISVTDGTVSRNLAVADNLTFSENSASWTPLTD